MKQIKMHATTGRRMVAIAAIVGCAMAAGAQLPAAPRPAQTAPAGAPQQATAPATPTFPPVKLANFTASTPTPETVNAFLKQLWGYDPNRVWSVAAIQKTPSAGVSRVVVYVADKGHAGKQAETVFFTLPDGDHAIAQSVISFGAKPFEATRQTLMARADGPSRGAKSKDLELVEFSDLQCPHCKDAAPTMDQLAADFPQARIVFQNLPLPTVHPFAEQAAAEGVCVQRSKGDAAFFTYASAVYSLQADLTPTGVKQTLATAASKAGAAPTAMAACAEKPATKAAVDASTKLADDLNVDSTPTLFVNGRPLPLSGVPYETLKKIVIFQAAQDGITLPVQPSLKSLQ